MWVPIGHGEALDFKLKEMRATGWGRVVECRRVA